MYQGSHGILAWFGHFPPAELLGSQSKSSILHILSCFQLPLSILQLPQCTQWLGRLLLTSSCPAPPPALQCMLHTHDVILVGCMATSDFRLLPASRAPVRVPHMCARAVALQQSLSGVWMMLLCVQDQSCAAASKSGGAGPSQAASGWDEPTSASSQAGERHPQRSVKVRQGPAGALLLAVLSRLSCPAEHAARGSSPAAGRH